MQLAGAGASDGFFLLLNGEYILQALHFQRAGAGGGDVPSAGAVPF